MASNRVHIMIFTQQFASMMRSKLPLVDVLNNLAEETPQRGLRDAIAEIAEDVQHGVDLGEAMSRHDEHFDNVYVNVVRAGMESGHLGEALSQIAHYLKVIHETARKLRSAVTYPVFVILAFFGIFNGMVFGILPRFQAMFASMHKKLPMPTQFLLDVGDYWKANWYWILGLMVVFIASFIAWLSTPEGRAIFDRYKLNVPYLGVLWRMGALARFLRTLAVQVENEVSVLQALRQAADTCGNVYIQETIYDIAADVERGGGLANSFRDHEVFHGIVVQMIAAGEEAGILDELLISSADYFDSLVQDMIDQITQLINPTLTIIVGLLVAGMMVAAFMPVFEMGNAAG
ncbi:MAG: type II secretion system F family protein [Rhodospirillaceae bacterium]